MLLHSLVDVAKFYEGLIIVWLLTYGSFIGRCRFFISAQVVVGNADISLKLGVVRLKPYPLLIGFQGFVIELGAVVRDAHLGIRVRPGRIYLCRLLVGRDGI